MRTRPLILFAMLLSVSCSGPKYRAPEFPVECEGRWEIISDELYIQVYDLWNYDSVLVVPSYNRQTKHELSIYSKKTGNVVYTGINSGNGPGETLAGGLNTSLDGSVLSYYDFMRREILCVDVDSLLEDLYDFETEVLNIPIWASTVMNAGDDMVYMRNPGYYDSDTSVLVRFVIQKKAGDILHEEIEYPIEDKYKRFALYNFAKCSMSPDKSRFVVGTSIGAILEIFSKDSTIECLNTKYFHEPEFEVVSGHYEMNGKTILGFNDIYAADDRIYAVYDGERNPYYAGEERLVDTKIAVFDWDGNPKELIRTDYGIDRICYSERENAIYGAVRDMDDIMYLARLDLNRLD